MKTDAVARRPFGACVAALLCSLFGVTAAAQPGDMTADGWYAWQVQATSATPRICCCTALPAGPNCDLDEDEHFGESRSAADRGGDVRIYVRVADDRTEDIRALSADCPVSAAEPITDFGRYDVAQSARWLQGQIEGPVTNEAIAAIALHEGEEALDVLRDTAAPGSARDRREQAIFWMAMVRLEDAAADLERFVFSDPDPEIRQHAAFSYAQSAAADIPDVLARQGRTDGDADVRAQAWFWLAENGAASAESAIFEALREDKDEDVREQAVFALSQLPTDRNVEALVTVLEEPDLPHDIREQALFWLAQSDSEKAFDYLDDLLGDN